MTDATPRVTPQELARHARELAQELEEGRGPELGHSRLTDEGGAPCCALGHLLFRSGLAAPAGARDPHALLNESVPAYSEEIYGSIQAVYLTNDCVDPWERSAAVVAPLRALADALDAMAARS